MWKRYKTSERDRENGRAQLAHENQESAALSFSHIFKYNHTHTHTRYHMAQIYAYYVENFSRIKEHKKNVNYI